MPSEIRDRVLNELVAILSPALSQRWRPHMGMIMAKIILIPDLAIVDRKASPPDPPEERINWAIGGSERKIYGCAIMRMLNDGWVKEEIK